jgi:hypothetical protein
VNRIAKRQEAWTSDRQPGRAHWVRIEDGRGIATRCDKRARNVAIAAAVGRRLNRN